MQAACSSRPTSKAWIWYREALSSFLNASIMDTRADLSARAGNETFAVFWTPFGAQVTGLAVIRSSATLARANSSILPHPALGMFELTCRVPVGFRTTSFIFFTVWVYLTRIFALTVNLGSHAVVPATYVLENLRPGQAPSGQTTNRVGMKAACSFRPTSKAWIWYR